MRGAGFSGIAGPEMNWTLRFAAFFWAAGMLSGAELRVTAAASLGEFSSLDEAVNAAKDGDVITVSSGTHQASVVINAQGLRIQGPEGNSAVLVPPSARPEATVLTVAGYGCVVSNLTIAGGGVALHVTGTGSLVTGVVARNQRRIGFQIEGEKNTLRACQAIGGNFRGFQLAGPRHHLFRNISKDNGNSGFCLSSASECLLQGNVADANRGSGFYVTDGSDGNLLRNNRSAASAIAGFYLDSGSARNELAANRAEGNERGIVLTDARDNIISNNKSSGSRGPEIQVKGASAGNRLLNNTGSLDDQTVSSPSGTLGIALPSSKIVLVALGACFAAVVLVVIAVLAALLFLDKRRSL